jgi:hypothetical protein
MTEILEHVSLTAEKKNCYVTDYRIMFLRKTVLMKKLCGNLKVLTLLESNRDVTFRASDLLFNIKFYVRCHYVLTSKPSFVRGCINA